MSAIRISTVSVIVFVAGLIAAFDTGCRAAPKQEPVFIGQSYYGRMTVDKNIPFDKVWIDPNVDLRKYTGVIVLPVLINHKMKLGPAASCNIRNWVSSFDRDLTDFSLYCRSDLEKAVEKDGNLTLTDKRGPNTLTVEMGIVNVIPNKPILYGTVTAFCCTPVGLVFLPFKLLLKGADDFCLDGSVAMEIILRDSQTEQVIAVFADNQKKTISVVNFNNFTAYGNLRQTVDYWSAQLIQVIEMNPKKPVPIVKQPTFELINY